MSKMFCFQCQQTAGGKSCAGKIGVCGKPAETSNLQDKLTGALIGLANTMKEKNQWSEEAEIQIIEGLFTTLTNVNFDDESILSQIERTHEICADFSGIEKDNYDLNKIWQAEDNVRSLKSLILFGIKGIAAYAYHAYVLGYKDEKITRFLAEALTVLSDGTCSADTLLSAVMKTGEINFLCMELLDKANRESFGIPSPEKVTMKIEKGPFIVISGHDLYDLKVLLEQTKDKNINIYTHGEMLPAHAYPELKKHPHLKGNFGTAWQNQQTEFDEIPAPVLFTTNCIMPPMKSYSDRVFTTAVTAYPGTVHIGEDKDFSAVIKKAEELGGYTEDRTAAGINGGSSLTVGFGHDAVLASAGEIIEAVKSGKIKHFILAGGCDGAHSDRSYFTELVKKSPDDTIILTLACGKYRFNDLDLGTAAGLPRILDLGQCNDAYSAVRIALALAEAFECSVNDLPLTLVLSWYEQKAVSILLSLLNLGIKNIILGPSLPAFISPDILSFLIENYGISPAGTADDDLRKMLS